MTLSFIPISDSFAHEVHGVSLWQPLTDGQVQDIQTALSSHGVLVFRRQSLSEDELAAFSRNFGPLDRIVRRDWQASHPDVIRISNMRDGAGETIGGLGSNELNWHTDQSYMTHPATGAVLQMVELPPVPVDTWWANMKLAYRTLSRDTQQEIESLSVVYRYAKRQANYQEGKLATDVSQKTPDVSHPLVCLDPKTGDKSLYLDPSAAIGISDLTTSRATSLIESLVSHVTQPNFVYRHRWHAGDVVFWDNGFLLHRRDAFDPSHCRLLKRTTLRLDSTVHIVPTGEVVL